MLRQRIAGTREPQRLAPTAFDSAVLDLIDASVSRCIPTGILLPIGGTHVPVIAAAAMLVRHISLTESRKGRIVLVTKDLGHRSFYRSLHFGKEPLHEHFPLQLILAGGTCSSVGDQARYLEGRFRVAIDVDRVIATGEHHDGIVVEAGAAEPSDMRKLVKANRGTVPIVYFTTNPFDPTLDTFEALGAIWAWSPEEIRRLTADAATDRPICADPALLASSTDTTYVVSGPAEVTQIDSQLARLWDDIHTLSRVAPGGDVRVIWAWSVAASLAGCPVPLTYHDLQASGAWGPQRFNDAPGRAAAFARNERGDLAEYFEVLAADLESAVEALAHNPKAGRVIEWIADLEPDETALIVTRNKTTASALTNYLHETPGVPLRWDDRVQVVSFSDLERGRAGWQPKTLFTGAVPHARAGLITTPAATELTILAHGPWESTRIVNQVRAAAAKLAERLRGEVRLHARETLFGAPPATPYQDVEIRPDVRRDESGPVQVPGSAREATWTPLLRVPAPDIKLDSEEDTARIAQASADAAHVSVEAIRIDFDDGVGFFDPQIRVSRIRDGRESEVAVKSLGPGDKVVLVDKGARSDLFNMIVTTLEDLPEYVPITLLVREWQARAASAKTDDITYREILERMRREGSSLTTTAAISHWIHGRSHGPDDVHDIRRFGAATGDTFLEKHWQRIGAALETMRAQRRTLGRRLARILQGTSTSGADHGYYDRSLGIHMSDLTSTLSTHRVEAVSTELVEVPSHLANILLTPGQARAVEQKGASK